MTNLFKGYAQKTELGSNLIKAVDKSDKIREEGRQFLSQWKDVSQGETENKRMYLAALEAKFQAQKADRARNVKLESYFADNWAKALQNRHNTLMSNAAKRVEKAVSDRDKLAKLTETGINAAAQVGGEIIKKQKQYATNLAIDLGLSWDNVQAIKRSKQIQDENAAGLINAEVEARKMGASDEQIHQIRKLNFLHKNAYIKGLAQRFADTHTNYLHENLTTEVETTAGTLTLAGAMQKENAEELELALRVLRNRRLSTLTDKDGISDQILGLPHVRNGILRSEGRLKTFLNQKLLASQNEQYKIGFDQETATAINESPQELMQLIYVRSGLKAENGVLKEGSTGGNLATGWSGSWSSIIDGIKSGAVNPEKAMAFLDYQLTKDGGTTQRIGDWYKARELEVTQAIAAALDNSHIIATAERNKLESEELAELAAFKEKFMNEGLPSEQDFIPILKQAYDKYGGESQLFTWLLAKKDNGNNAFNDAVDNKEIQDYYDQGLLTMSLLQGYDLTAAKFTEWKEKVQALSRYQPSKQITKELNEWAHSKVSELTMAYGHEAKDIPTATRAINDIKRKLSMYYVQYSKAGMSETSARDAAQSKILQEIKEGSLEIKRGPNGRPYLKNYALEPSSDPGPAGLPGPTPSEFSEDPDIFKKKLYLEPAELKKFWDNFREGRVTEYPAAASHFVNRFGYKDGKSLTTELGIVIEQTKFLKEQGVPGFENWELPERFKKFQEATGKIDDDKMSWIFGTYANTQSIAAALIYSKNKSFSFRDPKYLNPLITSTENTVNYYV